MLFTWILQTLERLHCKESYDLEKQKINSLFWKSSKWQMLLHWHEGISSSPYQGEFVKKIFYFIFYYVPSSEAKTHIF